MTGHGHVPLSGGCACGAIRFECSRKPLLMFLCHCRDCQRAAGSAYAPVAIFPAKAFRITKGEPRWYLTDRATGGKNRRGFCGACGARLFGAGTDRVQGVSAAAFDDSSWFQPSMNIFTSHAQAWDVMDALLPAVEGPHPSAPVAD